MIIDFRLRPPTAGYLETVMYTDPARRDRLTRQLGLKPAPSAAERSMPLCLAEMDEAGIARAVLPARHSNLHGSTTNAAVAAIMAAHPGRFLGFAAVDPTQRRRAVAQIEEAIALGFSGVNIEPGAYPEPLYPDDRRLYPLYAHCEDADLPVLMMAGGNGGPDLSYSSPVHVDRVAADFPSLRIIVSHGGWPWVHQILHVAYRRPNLYLSPDMYLVNMAGMQDYLDAANGYLQDRLLYASSYPLCPIVEYAQWFRRLPIAAEIMPKLLYGNAAALLRLHEDTPAGGGRPT